MQAYDALQGNRIADAQRLYSQVAQEEPRNVDALLGLAAIALAQGDTGQAGRLYSRALEIEPRNALAQAGLMSLVGGADPQGAESRLRQLIDRDPSALLYATLGDVYAGQRQWASAQQAYFQAHRLQPESPEHAYNLAVASSTSSQPRLALNFYHQALDLARVSGPANFSFRPSRNASPAWLAGLDKLVAEQRKKLRLGELLVQQGLISPTSCASR